MSAAYRSPVRPSRSQRQSVAHLPTSPSKTAPQPTAPQPTAPQPTVRSFPSPKSLPNWLVLLIRMQQGTSVLIAAMVVAVLAVYGWTVYAQEQWGQAYSRLTTLERRERQLTAADEVLKNQMAQQAERPGVGLVLPNPTRTVFLTPAAPRPPIDRSLDLPNSERLPERPMGY